MTACAEGECDYIPVGEDLDVYVPRATLCVCRECGQLRVTTRTGTGGKVLLYFLPFAVTLTNPEGA